METKTHDRDDPWYPALKLPRPPQQAGGRGRVLLMHMFSVCNV